MTPEAEAQLATLPPPPEAVDINASTVEHPTATVPRSRLITDEEPGFFNPWAHRLGQFDLQHETPRHRLILQDYMLGWGKKEIAAKYGVTTTSVGDLLRQPWAIEYLEEAAKRRSNTVEELLLDAAVPAVQRLIKLSVGGDSIPVETSRKASNDILNRLYGMPTQSIIQKKDVDLNTLSDQELAAIVKAGKN